MRNFPTNGHLIPLKPFLLFLLLTIIKSYCPGQYKFSHSTCHFYYSYSDESCNNFIFNKCSWQACITSDNSQTCSYQMINNTNWNSCTSTCCGNSNYIQQYNSIPQCNYDHSQSQNINMIIILSCILGVTIIVLMIVIFCCCKERIYHRCSCIKECCENISQLLYSLITCRCYARQEDSDTITSKNINNLIESGGGWSEKNIQNQKLKDICSICLESNPSIELECSHVFHRQCIIACINKKEQCALCRSNRFSKTKIYCQVCYQKYVQIDLKQILNFLNKSPQLCSACKLIDESSVRLNMKN